MAQPAGFITQDNRTDMGLSVFWTSASSDPLWNFKIWFHQFLLAVTVKENVNHCILLEAPKEVIDEPFPCPETLGTNEDEQAATDREARDILIIDEEILENEERLERRPKVGHNVYYSEVYKTAHVSPLPGTGHPGENVQKKSTHNGPQQGKLLRHKG